MEIGGHSVLPSHFISLLALPLNLRVADAQFHKNHFLLWEQLHITLKESWPFGGRWKGDVMGKEDENCLPEIDRLSLLPTELRGQIHKFSVGSFLFLVSTQPIYFPRRKPFSYVHRLPVWI